MPSPSYAPNAYHQAQVDGADSRRLVVLLARALVKFLLRAREAMGRGDLEAKAAALSRARGILSELYCSLDDEAGGELARNLRGLYTHWHSELVKVDLEDDLVALDYVISCTRDLADAWEEAYEKCREQERRQVA